MSISMRRITVKEFAACAVLVLCAGQAAAEHPSDQALVATSYPVATPPTAMPDVAPDSLLIAATTAVTAKLKQHKPLQSNTPAQIAALVEATILPLFDFHHVGRLSVARNWRLASPAQQDALIAEFRNLLVRTYVMALANYDDQTIEYMPLLIAPGATDVTVRSSVKLAGAERMNIDYDMGKTAAGWKVYDVRIDGVSKITVYRTPFGQIVNDDGIDGLISHLADMNRQTDSALRSHSSDAWAIIFMYQLVPSIFHGRQ